VTDDLVRSRFEASIATKQALLADEHVAFTRECAELIVASYRDQGRLLICGNGGSAADAMHLAAEFVGRYMLDREALSAISLSDSQSGITCIGNDYSFDEIFARAVRAHGRAGDVFLGLTTSGNSPNVVEAALAAKELGLRTVGMTGSKGGRIAEVTELCLRVPSDETPRIQEGYMLVGHTVCELVEASLFG
jgi:D-sedoheptulose 7-phosphate isomerase